MSEARRNYWVDAVLGVVFLVIAVSALVFLVPTSWIDFSASTSPTILGVDFGVWQTLYKWTGIVMLIGVVDAITVTPDKSMPILVAWG